MELLIALSCSVKAQQCLLRASGSVTDTHEEVVAEAVHNQLGKSHKPSSSPGF